MKFDEIKIVSNVNNYGTIPIQFLQDKNLSLKSKGLLAQIFYLKSQKADWTISVMGLTAIVKESKDTVLSCLKELQNLGYIYKKQLRNENGSFGKYLWIVYESPSLNIHFFTQNNRILPKSEKPNTENPNAVKTPKSEKPNTEKNTEVGKTEYGESECGKNPLKSPQPKNPNTGNSTLIDNDIDNDIDNHINSISREDVSKLVEQVERQIEYHKLMKKFGDNKNLIKLIRKILVQSKLSNKELIQIGKEKVEIDDVRETFDELNFEIICAMIDDFKFAKKINNLNSYTLKALYNAPLQYELKKMQQANKSNKDFPDWYKNQEQHDASDELINEVNEMLKGLGC